MARTAAFLSLQCHPVAADWSRGRRPSSSLTGQGGCGSELMLALISGPCAPSGEDNDQILIQEKPPATSPWTSLSSALGSVLKVLAFVKLLSWRSVCSDLRVCSDPTLCPDSGGLCWWVSPELISLPHFPAPAGPCTQGHLHPARPSSECSVLLLTPPRPADVALPRGGPLSSTLE